MTGVVGFFRVMGGWQVSGLPQRVKIQNHAGLARLRQSGAAVIRFPRRDAVVSSRLDHEYSRSGGWPALADTTASPDVVSSSCDVRSFPAKRPSPRCR